ncbi:MAG: hypothetical protein HWD86_06075, partial [Kangiellaceae bacterium]|nr:hypothetical protein [Kangiellaceae bacterium]
MNYKHWCIIFLIALISCKSDAELDVKIELAGHYDLSMVSKELQAQGANCNLINNELYCASSDM